MIGLAHTVLKLLREKYPLERNSHGMHSLAGGSCVMMMMRERDMALSDTPVRSNSTMQRRSSTSTTSVTSVQHYLTHLV